MVAHWKASGLPLTAERLRLFLSYDPASGRFDWLVPRAGRRPDPRYGAGNFAGGCGGGVTISVDGVSYSAARLAWLYVYNEWPIGDVFHRNGDGRDNRIDNLEDSLVRHRPKEKTPMSAELLRSLTKYDPSTGLFSWRSRSGRFAGKTKNGSVIGSWTDSGYQKATINYETYRVHRLAWLYMTGEWPKFFIDHINGDRGDNRWTNLREATQAENRRNNPGHKNRDSPYKGCYKRPNGRWGASIQIGVFDTPEEAHEAYMKAARLFFGKFARGS